MANDTVKFGRVLEESASDRKVWFFIVPAILALVALAGVGIYGISQSRTVKDEVQAVRAKADEAQKAVDQRDALLAKARADEDLLRSAGQATAIFYGIDPQAVESGVALAMPAERAAKVVFYGLQPPPEGQRYTLAAHGPDGKLTALRDVPVTSDGAAFVLARNVPEGTTALELVLRDASLGPAGPADPSGAGEGAPPAGEHQAAAGDGKEQPLEGEPQQAAAEQPAGSTISLDGSTPRVAAKYPAANERGVLTQAPATQARRPAR